MPAASIITIVHEPDDATIAYIVVDSPDPLPCPNHC
jgi:hypothetical protein